MFTKKTQEQPDFEFFSYYDSKVGLYSNPMLAINQHDIIRQLERLFKDPKEQDNQLLTNAEDFALFRVGTFTKKTGEIQSCKPEHVANLHEIRHVVERQNAMRQQAQQPIERPVQPSGH